MRLFYFLPLIFSFNLLAAPPNCDESDLISGDQIGVCTSLTIDSPVVVPPTSGAGRIWITGISGNVTITANITLDGGPGSPDLGFGAGGEGQSGPGASDGGGHSFGGPTDGNRSGTVSGPDGKTPAPEAPCSSGGGGAGFAFVGDPGVKCATSTTPVNGGGIATLAEFDYSFADFRGGFGGGAGATGNAGTVGAGGGGGGALHIEATGTITIGPGVTISAKGGAGGNNTSDGGGGGGGSGGAIWLVSTAGIINQGTINVTGGDPGRNFATGADGGKGESGRFRLESAGQITNGTGISAPTTSTPASSSKLNSDISCGTIAQKNNDNKVLLQIFAGFMIAMLMTFLFKTLSRIPEKLL